MKIYLAKAHKIAYTKIVKESQNRCKIHVEIFKRGMHREEG